MSDSLVRLAENVILLQKLNPEPEKACVNQPPHLDSRGRVLTIRHEREILESLCFLLASSDKPDHIFALSIEEKTTSRGIILSYAVNNGGHEALRSRIDGVAKILQAVTHAHDEKHRVALRHQVASHGQSRLLRRLKSRHQLSTQRSLKTRLSVAQRLKNFLESYQESHGTLAGEHSALWAHACDLQKQFLRLENLPKSKARSEEGLTILELILLTSAAIYNSHMEGLEEMVNNHSSKDPWDSKAKGNLLHTLKKLGHYFSATEHLLLASSRFPILRSIEARYVALEPAKIQTMTNCLTIPAGKGLLARYLQGEKNTIVDGAIPELRKRTPISLEMLQQQIQKQVEETRYRVHAEMKLLLYHEQQQSASSVPPRVIVSSKSACFLCDLYFKIHGSFYTPKTHGTLYEKWTLPSLKQLVQLSKQRRMYLDKVLTRLNMSIEERIAMSLRTGHLSREHPNESMVFPLAPFTPSVVSTSSITNQKLLFLEQGDTGHGSSLPVARDTIVLEGLTSLPTPATIIRPADLNSSTNVLGQAGQLQRVWVSNQGNKGLVASQLRRDSKFSTLPAIALPNSLAQDNTNVLSPKEPEMSQPSSRILQNIQEENIPDPLSDKETLVIIDSIHLTPGVILQHMFLRDSPPILIFTRKIDIELSRSCFELPTTSTIASERLYSLSFPLHVEIELLEPGFGSLTGEKSCNDAVDVSLLSPSEVSAPNGSMYSHSGLLLEGGGEVVALRIRSSEI